MTYYAEMNVAVVNIPKTATTALSEIIKTKTANRNLHFHRHETQSAVLSYLQGHGVPAPVFVANIREPVSRLVSGINYCYGKIDMPLSEAMDRAITQDNPAIFSTQTEWLDLIDTHETLLFDFASRDIFRYLGLNGTDVRNPSTTYWGRSQIEAHPRFVEAMDRYAPDFTLHQRVTHGPP